MPWATIERGPVPFGFCECGCGGRTTICDENDATWGYVKGQPKRFIRGHSRKVNREPYQRTPGDDLCECGCGQRTPVATRTDATTGRLKGRPMRFVHGHNARSSPVDYIEEDRGYKTPCWVWQLCRFPSDYGSVWDPLRGRMRGAHIVNYERKYGPVPVGLELDHLCRVRACCNPEHLEPVTHGENVRRGWVARRAAVA